MKYTKTELKERGWSDHQIDYWLCVPDVRRRNFYKPTSAIDSKYCIKLYDAERVEAIEPIIFNERNQ
jgi:hypothetical protein